MGVMFDNDAATKRHKKETASIARMAQDGREIKGLVFGDDSLIDTRGANVSKIKVYEEPGQCAAVPWFAVYDLEGQISQRIPAHMVVVLYLE